MTELKSSEKHRASIFRRPVLWLALRFSQHEAWALNFTRRFPLFSPLAFFSVAIVWIFLPVILLTILAIVIFLAAPQFWVTFVETYSTFVLFVVMYVCVVLVFLMFQWQWGWFFISVDLMFGSTRLLEEREDEVLKRIARLKKRMIAAREPHD